MQRIRLLLQVAPWALFVVWLAVQLPLAATFAAKGRALDFLVYRHAADALQQNQNPYLTIGETHTLWLVTHQEETELLSAGDLAEHQQVRKALNARPPQQLPYLYPPTLALLFANLGIGSMGFTIMLLLAICGFAALWLRVTGTHPAWLLLVILSVDIFSTLHIANIEFVLLGASLLALWLVWRGRGLLAAPLCALVLLIKPFYLLLLVAFGLLALVAGPTPRAPLRRGLVRASAGTLLLLVVEVLRWGSPLREYALSYLTHTLDYLWFVLPLAAQSPMSSWNRTPLQVLVNAGIAASAAQWLALALWALLLGLAVHTVRGQRLSFPLAFALALTLLYLGRPVGWWLLYLEFVVLTTIWHTQQPWQQRVLLAATIALMASHWWALVLTVNGLGIPLLTLQTAQLPWETVLVLPLCWLLLLRAARQQQATSGWREPGARGQRLEAPPEAPPEARGWRLEASKLGGWVGRGGRLRQRLEA